MIDVRDYWIELGGLKDNYFTRNYMLQLNDKNFKNKFYEFSRKYNNTDIYSSIYLYENKDTDNCKLYAPFYLDLDGDIHNKKGYEELKYDVFGVIAYFNSLGFNNYDIEIYFSGSKGFHIIIPEKVLGIEPCKELNLIYKEWAIYLKNTIGIKNIDTVIYDRKRLFRQENSINSKTNLYKTLLNLKFLYEASLEELLNYVKLDSLENFSISNRVHHQLNPVGAINFYKKTQNFYKNQNRANNENKPKFTIPKTKQEFLPCIQNMLLTSADKGNRNNTLVVLASSILQSGYSIDETIDIMLNWNELNNPPLDEHEVIITTRSAYTGLLDGKKYGCKSIKDLGFCSDSNCKFQDRR